MKRVFLSLFFGLILSLFLTTSAHAQAGSWVDTGYPDSMEAAQGGDVNAAAHVSNVNTNNYSDFIRRVLGPVPGITISANDMNTPYAKKMLEQSAVAGLSNYIYAMYANPPASTYVFVQDFSQTLGFIPKKAYAQGIGFSGLTALLPVWKQFRNISYAILALVMVVIGFMVMFRKKIDPKTVVTVQNALPKIVITLILITFSYAIVGIMIDLMYLVLVLGVRLLVTSSTGIFTDNHISMMTSSDFSGVWKGVFAGYASLGDLMDFLFPNEQAGALNLFNPAYDVVGILTALLLALAFLFGVIRIFFMLLTSYIQIIIALLTGPLQILLDAVPGGQGFSAWLKNLLSQLLVFPITAFLLTVGWILIKTSTTMWTPPLLSMGSKGVGGVIGLGVLLSIPSIIKGIQESLKAKPGIPIGAASALSPITGAFQMGTQAMSAFYYGKEFFGKKKPPAPPRS